MWCWILVIEHTAAINPEHMKSEPFSWMNIHHNTVQRIRRYWRKMVIRTYLQQNRQYILYVHVHKAENNYLPWTRYEVE